MHGALPVGRQPQEAPALNPAGPAGPRAGRATLAFLAAAGALVALLAWPLRHGSLYLDDFVFVALARHIDAPLELLYRDSLGAFFFRPLGVFLWWVTVQLWGANAAAHLVFGIVVHGANGVLLHGLLRRYGVGVGVAAVAALVFIAHPATYGAAAWPADRFDLFATFFGLAALIAIERHLAAPSMGRAAAIAALMVASMLSKEIGFAVAATGAVLLLLPGARHAATARDRWIALIPLVACVFAVLAARSLVLRDVAQVMFLKAGLVATLAGGMAKWTRYLPDFAWPFQGNVAAVVAWIGASLGFLGAALAPSVRARLASAAPRALAAGAALAITAAMAQTPIVHASLILPFALGHFSFDPLAGGRFYYLPFVGLGLFLGGVAAAFPHGESPSPARRAVAMALAAVAVVALASSSRAVGRDWARFPAARGEAPLRAAVAMVLERRDLRPGCKIHLLDLPPSADPLRGLVDTAVKHALPAGHPAIGCFILTEHTPWYNLVTTLPAGAEAPLETITFAGRPFTPLRVGNLSYYYLKATQGERLRADPNASFHAWRGGSFVDVTADVRAGRREVPFHDNRPPY